VKFLRSDTGKYRKAPDTTNDDLDALTIFNYGSFKTPHPPPPLSVLNLIYRLQSPGSADAEGEKSELSTVFTDVFFSLHIFLFNDCSMGQRGRKKKPPTLLQKP
jgi:hypothetical protein